MLKKFKLLFHMYHFTCENAFYNSLSFIALMPVTPHLSFKNCPFKNCHYGKCSEIPQICLAVLNWHFTEILHYGNLFLAENVGQGGIELPEESLMQVKNISMLNIWLATNHSG